MSVFEIRSHFLHDHAQLRGKVSVLRSLALSVLRGDEELSSALRLKGQDLQVHLHRHMSWEEGTLLPVLDRGNALGGEAANALRTDHMIQRERVAESLKSTEVAGYRPKQLARSIMELISWIESDMAREEAAVLASLEKFEQGSGQEFDQIKE